jgi:hypothetical protein
MEHIELCSKPKITLTRDSRNWIICSGLKEVVLKSGEKTILAVDPAYYGNSLEAALLGAWRRLMLKRPLSAPIVEFVKACTNEIAAVTGLNSERISKMAESIKCDFAKEKHPTRGKKA